MTPDSGESTAVAEPTFGNNDIGWLLRWFDAHPRPTFIVARDLRLVATNMNARKLLREPPMLALRSGYLSGIDRKLHALLTSAITTATFAEPVRRIFQTDDSIYVIRASVVDDTPEAFVSVSLRDTSRQPTCAPLQEVFGITKAEQRVIEQLLLGQTTEATAEALGTSILTVRTQMKHVYAKLGVSTREELFARLLPFLETGSTY